MIKKIMFSLMLCMNLCASITAYQQDFTFENLLEMGADHLPHFRRLFNTIQVQGFLECGCHHSTAYFLEHCDKVISIEYINSGYGDKWYHYCISLFSDRPNWIPLLYNKDLRSNSFNNACAYQCCTHEDYAKIDSSYLKELDKHFKTQIKNANQNGYSIDVAFVNPAIYIRGDLVKVLLSNKIPIVVAHNTITDHGNEEVKNLYGWNKVVTPDTYEKIFIPYASGTTFWISRKLTHVIASFNEYRDNLIKMQKNAEVTGVPWNNIMLIELADTFK